MALLDVAPQLQLPLDDASAVGATWSKEQPSTQPDGIEPDDATDTDPEDEAAPRVLGFPRPAKSKAVDKLCGALAQHLPPEDAVALAHAIVDPQMARNQLANPAPLRVPGGTFLTIRTDVYAAAVIAHPTNGRCAEGRVYPASGKPGARRPLVLGGTGTPVLDLIGQDRVHVEEALRQNADYLAAENNLNQSVKAHGVLQAITVTAARLVHAQEPSVPARHLLTAVDGSSRISACHRALGLSEQAVAYHYATNPAMLRRHVESLYGLSHQDPESRPSDTAGKLRAAVVPAIVVVGFKPDEVLSADFSAAVRSLVGLMHVNPPKTWGAPGEHDARGESVLAQLLETELVTEDEFEWMSGLLSPAEAVARGLSPRPDVRAAFIFAAFTRPDFRRAVNKGLRRLSVDASKSPRFETRVGAAVEMILRPIRPVLDNAKSVRTSLHRTLTGTTAFHNKSVREGLPWVVTDRSPDELLAAALEELRRSGSPGAAARELGVLGAYWLVLAQVLTRAPVRNATDGREPMEILSVMLTKPHGLHILHAAVVAGLGTSNGELVKIPVVADTGAPEVSETGAPRVLSADVLRFELVPPVGVDDFDEASLAAVPEIRAEQLWDQFVAHHNRSREVLRQLVALHGTDGTPLVAKEGLCSEEVEPIATQLARMSARLYRAATMWLLRHPSSTRASALSEDLEDF